MSAPTFPPAFPGVAPEQAATASGERPDRLRALAAIALLVALGILTATSLLASGDDWPVARARDQSPPAAHDGPIDPHC
jgi:hypothetical protein